ncbi:MAG: hypothetical protein OXP36_00210 [Gammaproteobacteria bacterium]|nr:hypothetical protein [Gammaproteobacteria bacterium]
MGPANQYRQRHHAVDHEPAGRLPVDPVGAGAAFRKPHSEDHEHQEEGENHLHRHRRRRRDGRNVSPHQAAVFRHQQPQGEAGQHRAYHLAGDVRHDQTSRQAANAQEPHGHGEVDVGGGYVSHRVDHRRHHPPWSGGHADVGDHAAGHVVDHDRAGSGEHER